MKSVDIAIIGGGVIGCATAYYISKFNASVAVLEAASDVATGASRANSGIIHAGFDADPSKLKGKLNAKSNAMFDDLARDLNFNFKRVGALVLAFNEGDLPNLQKLKQQGIANGVPNLKVLSGDEARKLEPNLTDEVAGALHAPTSGIICPYDLTIALAEQAATNGAEFYLNTKVENIVEIDNGFKIFTNNGDFSAKIVINAAGLNSDIINNFINDEKFEILPRRGQYALFDKSASEVVKRTIFQLPTKAGKGVLVTMTADGNLLVGPNAVDLDEKCENLATVDGHEEILNKARLSIKEIPTKFIITKFSGVRARNADDDFIIGPCANNPRFINAASIESPGLSSAPLIGEMISKMVQDELSLDQNANFNPKREKPMRLHEMNDSEIGDIIAKNNLFGKVVCRCEKVSEGEIVEAINRPVGARTVDGVKRRTRAGMGRCQGGFCCSKVLEILSRELNLPKTKITKNGEDSELLIGLNKDEMDGKIHE